MNLPNLLFDIHPLHPLHLLPFVQLAIVTRCCLLPPRLLLLANNRQAGHTIKDIGALRGETLQVGGHVGSRQIGG